LIARWIGAVDRPVIEVRIPSGSTAAADRWLSSALADAAKRSTSRRAVERLNAELARAPAATKAWPARSAALLGNCSMLRVVLLRAPSSRTAITSGNVFTA
jgi:hypothetical protein